jgi:hypothetical protein
MIESAPGGAPSLLEHVASGLRPGGGHVADVFGLRRGEVRHPLDVAAAGSSLDRPGNRLQRTLVTAERRLTGLLAGFDDALVQFACTLSELFETRVGRTDG